MDQRWTQIRKLFREALDLEPARWEAFLESRCPDEEMRQKVLAMLAAYDEDDTFLERPAAEVGPAAQQRDTETMLVGTRIGPYEIRRSIARGGMGVVFEALDTKLDKVVALKMMSPALVQDPTFRQRFEQEAKTLARLEDPHFVRVNALIDEGPNTFIVMEYVDGVTLAQHIRKKGPLAGKDAITVGIQLLQALSKAHRQGIVHRDLKPSNIMLTKTFEGRLLVKVLDFGIAKNLQPDGSQTRTIGAVGTLFYMSPEQARGLRTIDYRTDLYSLGVTMYEAVSGELPFNVGVDEYTVRQQIVEGHVIPLEKRKPGTAPALARVIEKALATDPEDRYATAEAMGKALVEALEEIRAPQTGADPVPVAGRDTSPPQNSKRPIPIVAGVGVLVAIIASFLMYQQWSRPVAEPAGQSLALNQPDSLSQPVNPLSSALLDTARGAPEETSEDLQHAVASISGSEPESEAITPISEEDTTVVPFRPVTPPAQLPVQEDAEGDFSSAVGQEGGSVDTVSLDDPDVPSERLLTTNTPDTSETQEQTLPPASPERGMLSVKMSPSGSVFVNDSLVIRNDLVYVDTLVAGMNLVRVENAAYGRWVCEMPIQADAEQDVTIDFDAAIPITVAAEDADTGNPILNQPIYVDGVRTTSTTPERIRMPTGLHRISLQMSDYQQVETSIDRSAGCFQKVGSLVNVDPQSVRGTSPPRIVLRMQKVP